MKAAKARPFRELSPAPSKRRHESCDWFVGLSPRAQALVQDAVSVRYCGKALGLACKKRGRSRLRQYTMPDGLVLQETVQDYWMDKSGKYNFYFYRLVIVDPVADENSLYFRRGGAWTMPEIRAFMSRRS